MLDASLEKGLKKGLDLKPRLSTFSREPASPALTPALCVVNYFSTMPYHIPACSIKIPSIPGPTIGCRSNP